MTSALPLLPHHQRDDDRERYDDQPRMVVEEVEAADATATDQGDHLSTVASRDPGQAVSEALQAVA